MVEALKPKRGTKVFSSSSSSSSSSISSSTHSLQVEGQGAKLLEFAGGSGYVNSSYRDAFKYRRDRCVTPKVIAGFG